MLLLMTLLKEKYIKRTVLIVAIESINRINIEKSATRQRTDLLK